MESDALQAKPLPDIGSLPPDLLLLVFIHGFKGTDSTFLEFPRRLQHVVSETISNVIVESIVFPAYDTKGELEAAVERFADWLATLTVEREVANGLGAGAGKAKIVLCGHSMGGLVAADTLIGIATSHPDRRAPIWPNVIACIAFDTPFLGLHPFVFKNSATKAFGYVQTAQKIATSIGFFSDKSASAPPRPSKASVGALTAPPPASEPGSSASSGWAKWAAPAALGLGGLLLSGAAAGTAYYRREDLGASYKWALDHMKYVGTLWDEERLKRRLERLAEIAAMDGVVFRDFYTLLPAVPPEYTSPRTFVILPANGSPFRALFIPALNHVATDEIEAHTGIFEARANDSYYSLGLDTARIVREAVLGSRGKGRADIELNAQRTQEKAEAVLTEEMRNEDDSREELKL